MINKSVIFYLVNDNPIHLRRLKNSLSCLTKNFLTKYPYPVAFGHENISIETQKEITSWLPEWMHSKHFFINLHFTVPQYSPEILSKIPERFKGHWDENAFFSIGYRHMCRFFAGSLYQHPSFENVNYLMRLDCDSYFVGEVKEDPFELMATTQRIYGTLGVEEDMAYVIEGLVDHCCNYFKTTNPSEAYPLTMYKTHFEIVDFQWFRSDVYQAFFKSIDETGNIYIKRWGDAPIKFHGVMNLLPQEKVHTFHLPYKHGGDL